MNVRPYLEEDLKKMMKLEEKSFSPWEETEFLKRGNFVAVDGENIVGFISYREKEGE